MWTVRNHWKKVIFSDETKIDIGNNRKVYAWRKVDEKLRPECNELYQGRNYKTKFSVMFWGCISVHIKFDRQNRFLFSRLTGEIVIFLQTGCFLYPSKIKRLRTVLRKVDEKLRPECNELYQGRNYKTKFSVMFWGCISYYGVGTLTPVVGNLNTSSEKYINILDDKTFLLFPISIFVSSLKITYFQ
jgi:hypothetical protein